MSVHFDTLGFSKELQDAGLSRETAEKLSVLLQNDVLDGVATKRDLTDVETELKHQISTLEHRMTIKLGAIMVAGVAVIVAAQRLL